jgi:hypothetical protein
MLQLKPLTEFFTAIGSDPRINTTHITLYMGLLKFWFDQDCKNPVYVYLWQVMQLCKISGNATYHKIIQEPVLTTLATYLALGKRHKFRQRFKRNRLI